MRKYIVVWFPFLDILKSSEIDNVKSEIGFEIYDDYDSAVIGMRDYVNDEGIEDATQVLLKFDAPDVFTFLTLYGSLSIAHIQEVAGMWAIINRVFNSVRHEILQHLAKVSNSTGE